MQTATTNYLFFLNRLTAVCILLLCILTELQAEKLAHFTQIENPDGKFSCNMRDFNAEASCCNLFTPFRNSVSIPKVKWDTPAVDMITTPVPLLLSFDSPTSTNREFVLHCLDFADGHSSYTRIAVAAGPSPEVLTDKEAVQLLKKSAGWLQRSYHEATIITLWCDPKTNLIEEC